MQQVKIKKTEKYNDSQGEHIVTRGILKLIETNEQPIQGRLVYNKDWKLSGVYIGLNKDPQPQESRKYTHLRLLRPVIISDESIEVGDVWLNRDTNTLHYEKHLAELANTAPSCKKVIALPNHFSLKHLQAIVSGKLKDGDNVYVECIKYIGQEVKHYKDDLVNDYIINLNPSSQIKLFRTNQDNWNDIFIILNNPDVSQGTKEAMIRERYNSPTRK